MRCLLLLLCAVEALAEATPLWMKGSPEQTNRINLVFVTDGFDERQLAGTTAAVTVTTIHRNLFTVSPYREYQSLFQSVFIPVTSPGSGIPHWGTQNPTPTSFGSTCAETQPGWCTPCFTDVAEGERKLRECRPEIRRDYQIIVVNSGQERGGAHHGDAVLMSSASSGEWCLAHEMGHYLGDLADEYHARKTRPALADEKSNITGEPDPTKVKWRLLASLFPEPAESWHHSIPNDPCFSPRAACRMRGGDAATFCEICQIQLVRRMFEHVNLIDVAVPSGDAVELASGGSRTFKVTLLSLAVGETVGEWFIDGAHEAEIRPSATQGAHELTLTAERLKPGTHTVRFMAAHRGFKLKEETITSLRKKSADPASFHNERSWLVHVRGEVKMTEKPPKN